MFICAVCGTQGAQTFWSGYPAGRIGDRGDREIVDVPNAYVPFLAPRTPGNRTCFPDPIKFTLQPENITSIIFCFGNAFLEILHFSCIFFSGINFPKITLHVFVCDSEHYMEKSFGNYFLEITT